MVGMTSPTPQGCFEFPFIHSAHFTDSLLCVRQSATCGANSINAVPARWASAEEGGQEVQDATGVEVSEETGCRRVGESSSAPENWRPRQETRGRGARGRRPRLCEDPQGEHGSRRCQGGWRPQFPHLRSGLGTISPLQGSLRVHTTRGRM